MVSYLGDSHCHLSTSCTVADADKIVAAIGGDSRVNRPNFFSLMCTNHIDIDVVEKIMELGLTAVFPYFGVHPWFSHLFSDGKVSKQAHYEAILKPGPGADLLEVLPEPIDINEYVGRIQLLHEKFGGGIGEIGLDKVFRVPYNGFYGNPEVDNSGNGDKLSPCRVSIDHQVMILRKQLGLADALRAPVSLHCVKAHGIFYDTVREYGAISSVILHSFSGSVDQAKIWVRSYAKSAPGLYFSFSNYINGVEEKSDILSQLVGVLAEDQVLVETDYSVDLFLERFDEYLGHLDLILAKVRATRQWTGEDMVARNQQRACGRGPV